jgi:hypothetical protein
VVIVERLTRYVLGAPAHRERIDVRSARDRPAKLALRRLILGGTISMYRLSELLTVLRIGVTVAGVVIVGGCLSSCTHSKAAYLSDGRAGYAVSCGGIGSTWTDCLVRAGRLCGAQGYSVSYSDEIDRRILVECGQVRSGHNQQD